jgi:hypothetical protein
VTLVDQQTVEPDLVDDEALEVGAEVEGGGRAIVVDRIGPEAHQGRRAGDTIHYQSGLCADVIEAVELIHARSKGAPTWREVEVAR